MGLSLHLVMVGTLDDVAALRLIVDGADGVARSASWLVIDSVWDCLDVIVDSGSEQPPMRAVTGGEPVADFEGRTVVALSADEVSSIAEVLAQMEFSAALLDTREAVEELYGGTIVGDEDEDDFRALFEELKDFYARAALRGQAVIKW